MVQNVLIVYRVDRSHKANVGVIKKLQGQIEGFEQLNIVADYVIHDSLNIYLNNKTVYRRSKRKFNDIFKLEFYNKLKNVEVNRYDLIIIRYSISTPSMIRWLKGVKTRNSKCIIAIDLPTFPYEKEWKGLRGMIVLGMDRVFRRKLKSVIDFVLHSGRHEEVFGIKTLRLGNGISLSNIPVRQYKRDVTFNFIAMAKWNYWHGLDRLFHGFSHYNGNESIHLFVIGEGPELESLRNLAQSLKIEKLITFSGVCSENEISDLFDICDIGVGTLALHRKGVSVDSSLKHRSYVARGLPFIMAGQDIDISNRERFVYHVPPDESIIEVSPVVGYLKELDIEDTAPKMRIFAEHQLVWKLKWKKVIDYIESGS